MRRTLCSPITGALLVWQAVSSTWRRAIELASSPGEREEESDIEYWIRKETRYE